MGGRLRAGREAHGLAVSPSGSSASSLAANMLWCRSRTGQSLKFILPLQRPSLDARNRFAALWTGGVGMEILRSEGPFSGTRAGLLCEFPGNIFKAKHTPSTAPRTCLVCSEVLIE